MADNQLCGLDSSGRGTYTAEGITKLCEALKGSAVTSLECAAAPSARLSVNARWHACSLTLPTSPNLCSLWGNEIGDKGASALAAILTETMISNLKCAATR